MNPNNFRIHEGKILVEIERLGFTTVRAVNILTFNGEQSIYSFSLEEWNKLPIPKLHIMMALYGDSENKETDPGYPDETWDFFIEKD